MGDERWAEIHARRLSYAAAPIVHSVNTRNPTCPEHCSGKHGTDGVLTCPKCRRAKYRIVTHEWSHQEGHYWNTVEPLNGAAPYHHRETRCCGVSLVRTA